MEEVIEKRGSKKEIQEELLSHFRELEVEGWEVIGWYHIQMDKTKWLKKPEKLSEAVIFKIFKAELERGFIQPRHSSPDGLVSYQGLDPLEPELLAVESINFSLWLIKNEKICIVSYGCHKFDHEISEDLLGGAKYSIAFKNTKDIFLKLLNKNNFTSR